MTSSYPGALDSLSNPSSSDAMNSGAGHAAQHANANDAIEAIQAELGTDPAGGSSTVKDRLTAIEGTLPDPTGQDGKVLGVVSDAYALVTGGGGGGGGGLVLVDSGTFSAVSAVNIDDVFDSTYDAYKVMAWGTHNTSGSDGNFTARLRASGTDNSSSVYDLSHALLGSGFVQLGGLSQTSWLIDLLYPSHGVAGWSFTLDVLSPAEAAYTHLNGQSEHLYNDSVRTNLLGGVHRSTSAFDGFSLICTGPSNFTGRWAVYGYAK